MSLARAVRLDAFGIDNINVVDVEVAEPGPNEVRVRFAAASLNYRDLMTVRGWYNPKTVLPRVLGSDAAGRVTAVGERVTRFAVGDRVTSLFFQDWEDGELQPKTGESALGGKVDGVFQTEKVMPEVGVIHAPASLTDEEAATLPCAALTAWNGLVEKGRLRAGQTVVVLGTGGVSIFGLQLAKAAGARVIVTSSSDEKLERARAMGADETINYRTTPEWEGEVLRLTGGAGADHVVEVGGPGTLPKSLAAVRPEGHVYLIGVLSEPGKGVDVSLVLRKSIHLDGVYVGSRAMFARMNAAIEANAIKPVVDRVFGVEEAREAFKYLEGAGHFGKVVLRLE